MRVFSYNVVLLKIFSRRCGIVDTAVKNMASENLKVVKFGGSSLADAQQFRKVGEIIKSDTRRRYVVPSAPGKRFSGDDKVTDLLYSCYETAKKGENIDPVFARVTERYYAIVKELDVHCDLSAEFEYIRSALIHHAGRDYIASRGEYLSAKILSAYLGFDFIDAGEVIFFNEKGEFDSERTNETLTECLALHEYAVIPGFYGTMPNGTIKTFSRGGSDISGSIVARAAKADIYENWTDVSGFLMADPRIIKDPEIIDTITYRELRELSYMGATVLHEDSIFPVRFAGIPINIRNTNRPEDPGTMIVPTADESVSDRIITGIAGKKGFSVITLEKDMMNSELGFGRRMLQVLENEGISFEHLPSGIDTMSVIVNTNALEGKRDRILSNLCKETEPETISIEDDLALIAVVGRRMISAKGTAARVLNAISKADINIRMIDQGSCELNIIVAVSAGDFEAALTAIYNEFIK